MLADVLIQPWSACLEARVPELRVFDPDGWRLTARELRRALDVVHRRALAFPLAERDAGATSAGGG